jgi:hypothetical protein
MLITKSRTQINEIDTITVQKINEMKFFEKINKTVTNL